MSSSQTPRHWLVKTEPGAFSFQDLERDGKTVWDGIRNHQARNNLSAMAVGDCVLIYHSITGKEVVGLAEVSRAAYPDPTDNPDQTWLVVDIRPIRRLKSPVPLSTIKADEILKEIPLVRQSRLSVMPLNAQDFNRIVDLSEKL